MQGANWDTIRVWRGKFVDAASTGPLAVDVEVRTVGNGFSMTYPDGSQVIWMPTITMDAKKDGAT